MNSASVPRSLRPSFDKNVHPSDMVKQPTITIAALDTYDKSGRRQSITITDRRTVSFTADQARKVPSHSVLGGAIASSRGSGRSE